MLFDQNQFDEMGFAEVAVEDGMTNASKYTAECSGSRSDCCTRTCKGVDPTIVGTSAEWDAFLSVKGGEIQY